MSSSSVHHYEGNIISNSFPSSSSSTSSSLFFNNSSSNTTSQGYLQLPPPPPPQSPYNLYEINNNNSNHNVENESTSSHLYGGPTTSLFQSAVAMGPQHYPSYDIATYHQPPATLMGDIPPSERNYYQPRPISGSQGWLDHHRQDNTGFYPRSMYPPIPGGNPWANSFANSLALRPRQAKPKRPRMSLQKRLLVNSRERERMRILNKAFESLRDALPCYIADGHMAKITTLRLAINYIKALTDLLNEQRVMSGKSGGVICRKERTHEDIFSTILKDSKVEGVKPVLKNLNERLAITKAGQQQQDMFDAFPSVIQYY